jgi:hypothetical protein
MVSTRTHSRGRKEERERGEEEGRDTHGKDRLDNERVVLLERLSVRLGERLGELFGLVSLRAGEGNLGELEAAVNIVSSASPLL